MAFRSYSRRLWILLVLVLALAIAGKANASWLSSVLGMEDEQSSPECGKKLDEMRAFLSKVRICRNDEDCTSISGFCPIGCKIYFNKLFEKDVEKDLIPLHESCAGRVCPYECDEDHTPVRPVCRKNRCVGTTLKDKNQ